MMIISHRGNLDGTNPELENTIPYIDNALNQKFYVEMDVWYQDNKFWSGHDFPQHEIDWKNFNSSKYIFNTFIHAKNLEALVRLKSTFETFALDKDYGTITSKNKIWAPIENLNLLKNDYYTVSCGVLIGNNFKDFDLSYAWAICTDYPLELREYLKKAGIHEDLPY